MLARRRFDLPVVARVDVDVTVVAQRYHAARPSMLVGGSGNWPERRTREVALPELIDGAVEPDVLVLWDRGR